MLVTVELLALFVVNQLPGVLFCGVAGLQKGNRLNRRWAGLFPIPAVVVLRQAKSAWNSDPSDVLHFLNSLLTV